MRILFLENDDSYSWNVVELLRGCGAEVQLERGNALPAERIRAYRGDAFVIGPGPLDPQRAGLLAPLAAILETNKPLLGICLGHQAIGQAFGARVIRTEPAHGVRARARFSRSRWFPAIEGELEVMRYHSLALDGIAAPLRPIARTADGINMAVEHESRPIAGLQFHPDSFATPRGLTLVRAFLRGALAGAGGSR